ncbi:MAG: 3-isopropylmalate dehydratase small subunit [Candidatus Binatia bacterium]|nr:MAG: 3-isopropylmalate dehydratase small subunit [Candidatus Binatia bacterium]
MKERTPIRTVRGRPLPIRGNDIDTDQILPARFMKVVTFDGLGRYAFHDLRFDAEGRPRGHVLDDPRFATTGARIALVNKNFGCGSSREHAPQALWRCGIRAMVGESFADIFFANCVAIGLPCAVADPAHVAALMEEAERDPEGEVLLDLEKREVSFGGKTYPVSLPSDARALFLEGTWNTTGMLLEAEPAIRETAARLPYVTGFRGT